ncbi:MAG: sodium:solute symporter family protein [Burkholderiaceae bacterium]|nr:sodium:solute symporter family protein [Burkholderiaceae bacterium]
MLTTLVMIYLAVTVGIGLYAAQRVKSSKDYLVAGRSLPLYMNVATVFATWFGAETVLGVSSTFLREGLGGVVADPFGASFCLIIVALVFARPFYRMELLTIGDFYRKRYNRTVEIGAGLAITLSYLGWTSAQMVALGIVFNTLSGGTIPLSQGIVLGAMVVLVYTLFGGMWSVAFTDLFQTVIIIVGLLYIAFLLGGMAGGFGAVWDAAVRENKLRFWPSANLRDWIAFVAAWGTMAIGSIAQQDVFQRVTSAKTEDTAVRGTLLGGAIYFVFAFVPMFIAVSALLIEPDKVRSILSDGSLDFQLILPQLILDQTPLFAQVMFFGALLSAILSTASGALLAPTAVFTENVLRPLLGGRIGDKQMLVMLRMVLVIFALCVMLFALNSESSMFQMVQNAYKVTLVAAFTPLAFGLFWRRATPQGAMMSVIFGLVAWGISELSAPDALIPPQFVGLGASIFGMVFGSIAPRIAGGAGHPDAVRGKIAH